MIDILIEEVDTKKVFGLECKYQSGKGSADEKLIYALEDLNNLRIAAVLVYAGDGFKEQFRHHLMASPHAAYCLPPPDLSRSFRNPRPQKSYVSTRQLDISLATYFDWWDEITIGKNEVLFNEAEVSSAYQALALPQFAPPEKSYLDDDSEGMNR